MHNSVVYTLKEEEMETAFYILLRPSFFPIKNGEREQERERERERERASI